MILFDLREILDMLTIFVLGYCGETNKINRQQVGNWLMSLHIYRRR